MKRIVLAIFAALLLVGNLAGATPVDIEKAAEAIFAPDSAACPEGPNALGAALDPAFAQITDFTCGMCSVPACQGSSPTTYCGVAPDGTKKYCQAGALCSGEGVGVRRCLCVVGGDIIP